MAATSLRMSAMTSAAPQRLRLDGILTPSGEHAQKREAGRVRRCGSTA
jgi:hypothetical protein